MTSSLGTTGKNSVKGAQQTGQGLSGKIPSTGAAKSTAKGSAKVTENLDSSLNSANLKGEYRKVKGHHVHAKKAFEGHVNYDPAKGFSISEELMRLHGIKHLDVTTAQRRLFTELAKSGRPNIILEHNRIAVEALMEGGCKSLELARSIVAESLQNLRLANVREPMNIPWHGPK